MKENGPTPGFGLPPSRNNDAELLAKIDSSLLGKRSNVYTLIQDRCSVEVLAGLEELLPLAKDGTLTGFVFGGMIRGRKYFVSCTGTAYADPTLARGVTRAIDDELQLMVQTRIDRNTTLL
jgi:hypothetical protein